MQRHSKKSRVSEISHKRRFFFGMAVFCGNAVWSELPARNPVSDSFHRMLSCGETERQRPHTNRVDNACTDYSPPVPTSSYT